MLYGFMIFQYHCQIIEHSLTPTSKAAPLNIPVSSNDGWVHQQTRNHNKSHISTAVIVDKQNWCLPINVNDPKSQGVWEKTCRKLWVFPKKSCATVNMFHSTEASFHHPGLVGASKTPQRWSSCAARYRAAMGYYAHLPRKELHFFHHRETPLSKVSPLNILPWIWEKNHKKTKTNKQTRAQ